MAEEKNEDIAKNNANGKEADSKPGKPEESKGTGQGAKVSEAEDLRDKLLRLAAEFDNYKKRSRSELERAKNEGKAELVKSLLPIIDEFELAVLVASKSKDENVSKGIAMVFSNLMDALKSFGMREIPTEGAYDPYRHEIITMMKSDKDGGSILEVVKKGYTFNGIMLRPASVIIAADKSASNPKPEKASDEANSSEKQR